MRSLKTRDMKAKTILKFIIVLLIYASSCVYNTHWYRLAYGEHGRWSNIDPDIMDVVFCYFPLVNIGATGCMILDSPYDKPTDNNLLIKIFKPNEMY